MSPQNSTAKRTLMGIHLHLQPTPFLMPEVRKFLKINSLPLAPTPKHTPHKKRTGLNRTRTSLELQACGKGEASLKTRATGACPDRELASSSWVGSGRGLHAGGRNQVGKERYRSSKSLYPEWSEGTEFLSRKDMKTCPRTRPGSLPALPSTWRAPQLAGAVSLTADFTSLSFCQDPFRSENSWNKPLLSLNHERISPYLKLRCTAVSAHTPAHLLEEPVRATSAGCAEDPFCTRLNAGSDFKQDIQLETEGNGRLGHC
ncbi:PREDICTED: uncharacterized protein LOC105596805 [Cercocebus atys]|uniref:uncharacterized protein LOC105596805 n=1 Tax=Cercocebus atys TaxID=9531 RepID=UPI0005F3F510|nr:PREDICTED: uncharacterized protein LOC105596805 [Cercocebus atys]